MKILFVGTSDLGIPTLRALAAEGRHEIRVVTKDDSRAGRGRRLRASPVKEAAAALGLDVSVPADINAPDALDAVHRFGPDVILVASYGAKLSEALLDLAVHRGINIHPSLLPRYRGAAPAQHTILNGDEKTGVSVIRVAPRMDSGDILGRVEVAVEPRETADDLLARLSRTAPPVVQEVLAKLEAGGVDGIVQDESEVVPARRLEKKQGKIDWTRDAVELDRFVRGMTPWPGAYTFIEGSKRPVRITVLEAVPVVSEDKPGGDAACGQIMAEAGRFIVACRGGALEILKVQREGKKPTSGEEFLRGIRISPEEPVICGPGEA